MWMWVDFELAPNERGSGRFWVVTLPSPTVKKHMLAGQRMWLWSLRLDDQLIHSVTKLCHAAVGVKSTTLKSAQGIVI